MIPTFFTPIVLLIGIWLLRQGSPLKLLCAMLAFGLFEASAAMILPVLSYSSIPPARVLLLFLLMSLILKLAERAALLREAVVANASLIIFCAYGAIGAFLLPVIFAGQISLVPMRPTSLRNLLDSYPLAFSAQNVTTGVYLIGTALTAIAAYAAGRLANDVSVVVKTCILVAFAQAITGIMGVALAGTPWTDLVDLIRNGSYSQVNQVMGDFGRINGFMSEPSSYARFGMIWMVFCCELWLRDVSPRYTGAAALMLAMAVALSLSSTAYIALGAYAALIAVRVALFPAYARVSKIVPLTIVAVGGVIGALVLIILSDSMWQQIVGILERLTLNKSTSLSGQQRLYWATQGIDAFLVSWGLGVGAGSFRSSSILTAILGSMGVIGILAYAAYVLQVFDLGRPRSTDRDTMLRFNVASAAAVTLGMMIVPAAIIQGSPDPGMEFAALAGLSLALRRPAFEKPRAPGRSAQAVWGAAEATTPQAARSAGWRRLSS